MTMPGIPNSSKWNRNYSLTISTPTSGLIPLVIQPPFTLEMDITRNTLTSANVCQIRLYNLSALNRELIRFNAYNQKLYKQITLLAGYGNNLSQVFNGNISAAWSVREGVNFITQIECYDGGFAYANSDVNLSFPSGTPVATVITALIATLPNVTLGAIGNFTGVLPKDNTYSGNATAILYELTGGAFYIDSGRAFALKTGEYNASFPVTQINASTGLLNTPVLEQTTARFEMLFEPTLNVGTLANVTSATNPSLNGVWNIVAVKHRGIISQVVSGDLTTTGEFYYSKIPIPVIGTGLL